MNKFGMNSVFYKTLWLLMTLSLITVVIFGLFINQLVVKNQRQNIDKLNLHQLQRISSNVEMVFDLLSQSMTRSMWSDDFIDLMIAPNQNNADLSFRVIQVLQDQVDENDLVRKSYLYLPQSEKVYVYSGTYMDIEYLGDRDMIYNYMEMRSQNRDIEATSEWRVLLYNRRIFLATDFCLPNFVGAMFYEINRSALYDIIQSENANFDTTIYVYNQNGGLLFDYMAAGLQPRDFQNQSLFLTADSDNSKGSYYMHTSDTLGWKYLVRINPNADTLPYKTILGLLLPILVFYIFVSQLFSFYITRTVYKPIQRLIQITTNPRISDRKAKREKRTIDETDFLELAYRDSLDKNEQHQELMQHISQDLLEQLLRSTLTGKNVNAKLISQTLDAIGRHDLMYGRYIVVVAELVHQPTESVSIVEEELYQRSFLRILSEIHCPNWRMAYLPMEPNRIALLMCFDKSISSYEIYEASLQMKDAICEQVQPLPYQLKIGKGSIYEDLVSTQFSYLEALEDILYLHYIDGSQEGELVSDDVKFEKRYYTERARHGYSMVESGRLEDAKLEFEQIVNEIITREVHSRDYLQRLIDDTMEKLISCRVAQEDIARVGLVSNLTAENATDAQPDDQATMKQFFEKSLNLIAELNRKNHNRYVEEAKEYIASHYMDGALSLNTISESVGISPSYLSGIFAESTGTGPNAYLNDYRIRQAKRLLNETNLNISEIGFKCGFNSAQSFTRVFKKHTGMSPKQFRELP